MVNVMLIRDELSPYIVSEFCGNSVNDILSMLFLYKGGLEVGEKDSFEIFSLFDI